MLQQALKFDYGNKAVRHSSFPAYKIMKRAECDALATSLVKYYKKSGRKLSSRDLKDNRQYFNPVLKLIFMRIAIRVWKEYLLLYNKFTDMEGGIVSDKEIVKFINRQRKLEIKYYSFKEPTNTTSFKKSTSLKTANKSHMKLLAGVYQLLLNSKLCLIQPKWRKRS